MNVTKNINGEKIKGNISVDTLTAKLFKWTIELMDSTDIILYADIKFKINSITNIKNSPNVTIEVNSSSYTLENTIEIGDEIFIEVNTNSVIKLNCELVP